MEGKKLLLQPWAPGQDESSWPSEVPVWIRLRGIPYHCWSSDILLSIAASVGKPLRLDEITAKQRMFSFQESSSSFRGLPQEAKLPEPSGILRNLFYYYQPHNCLASPHPPHSSPLASVIPTQTSLVTEHPTNSSILSSETPLSALPSDVVFHILEKIPAPALDCSNAFSIPENCTFVDPTLSTANLKKMSAAQIKKKRIIHVPVPIQATAPPASSTALVPTTPPASSTANPAPGCSSLSLGRFQCSSWQSEMTRGALVSWK
ncbi:hypothetical protein MRB53_027863 [Persea americana]|uniref:Uncharacterized protein n=1 Tax=Persea americana TaxID=3435 RepID=A0ACC2KEE7_PERAE|nr:hypothetical protein MRB53_027863 [Persea americana]